MSRRPQQNLNDELADLQEALTALTLRVADLRNQQANQANQPNRNRADRIIGDRVRFHIVGRGYTEGVIVARTAHRVQIRQNVTNHIFSRAPHNTTIIDNHV
jgi:hypothetical protein